MKFRGSKLLRPTYVILLLFAAFSILNSANSFYMFFAFNYMSSAMTDSALSQRYEEVLIHLPFKVLYHLAIAVLCLFAYNNHRAALIAVEFLALWFAVAGLWATVSIYSQLPSLAAQLVIFVPVLFWAYFAFLLRRQDANTSTVAP